EIYQFKS
ncbi:polymorphic outer membrane protein, partial [Chlamydia psittaci C1/97]